MNNALTYLVSLLDVLPGLKTKIAAVAAFALAVVQAWNAAAPGIGVDFTIPIPDIVNAIVLALLGAGTANAQHRLAKK
jgi:uncharacterized membrane protein YphA (DoxX/SURF4 family)